MWKEKRAMTLEQRLKTMLGEMQFTIAALQTQLEQALAANQAPAKQDEPHGEAES